MKISDGVFKIKGDGSVYVILGSKIVVIDTSNIVDGPRIKKEIEKIVPLEKINIVLLTHLHYDHLGNIGLFPNAEIYANAEEIGDYRKNADRFHFYVNENVDKILKEKLKPLPNEIVGLKVVRVPGHTRGSVAFLDEKRKLLFSGDTLFANDIIGRTDLPNSVPEKMDESVANLVKMIEDDKLLLCPGHGY